APAEPYLSKSVGHKRPWRRWLSSKMVMVSWKNPKRRLILTGILQMTPENCREYSRFSWLPARQKRNSDSYRHLGQPGRWSGADLAIFAGIRTHSSHQSLLNACLLGV